MENITITEVDLLDTPESRGFVVNQAEEVIKASLEVANDVLNGKCFTCTDFDNCRVPKDIGLMRDFKSAAENALQAIKGYKNASTVVANEILKKQKGE